jgi:hypothetical protein
MFLYKLFSIYAESVQTISVDKNIYIFVPNFCMLFFMPKYTPGELFTIL